MNQFCFNYSKYKSDINLFAAVIYPNNKDIHISLWIRPYHFKIQITFLLLLSQLFILIKHHLPQIHYSSKLTISYIFVKDLLKTLGYSSFLWLCRMDQCTFCKLQFWLYCFLVWPDILMSQYQHPKSYVLFLKTLHQINQSLFQEDSFHLLSDLSSCTFSNHLCCCL